MRSGTGAAVLGVTAVLLLLFPLAARSEQAIGPSPRADSSTREGGDFDSASSVDFAPSSGPPAGGPTPGGPPPGRSPAESATTPPSPTPAPTTPRDSVSRTVLVVGSVFFPSGATELGPDATRMLDGVAKQYRGTSQRLEIVGHADGRGNAAANLQLSAQRAEAVRGFLVRRGIPEANMVVKYDGARTPMARGIDPEANAQNRRVEVRVP